MTLVLLLALLLCSAALETRCVSSQFKTDRRTRTVYKCIKGRWAFHGKILRPRDTTVIKAVTSHRCANNPDLRRGTVGGFACNARTAMKVLDCVNTKMTYICHDNEWQVYIVKSVK